MANLIAAAVFFLGIHFGVSGTRLRDRLVRVVGEKAFRGLFALASIVGSHLADQGVLHCAVRSAVGPADRAEARRGAAGADRSRVRRHRHLDAEPDHCRHGVAAHARGAGARHDAHHAASVSVGHGAVGARALRDQRRSRHRRSCSARCSCSQSSARHRSTRSVVVPTASVGSSSLARLPTCPSLRSPRDAIDSRLALREIGIVRPLIAIAVFVALFLLHGRLFGAPLA